ncbi:hypothetical protein JQK62_23890, partial [Leptospira santarosai]|nr:hypothetical protein [Leptospira santarosai]
MNGISVLTTWASIESQSTHPLAQAITKFALDKGIVTSLIPNMKDVPGWGIEATVGSNKWKVGKPSFVGTNAAKEFHNGISSILTEQGKTVVFAADDEGIIAVAALRDQVRLEAKEA